MAPTIKALKLDGKNKEIVFITANRAKEKKQIHIGLKRQSLFLTEKDAFELCNRIIDELEK